jgi:hypothetical protein
VFWQKGVGSRWSRIHHSLIAEVYENFPHARSVAHQMIQLPTGIRAPSTAQPWKSMGTIPEASTSTGGIIAR